MKLSVFFVIILCMHVSAKSNAQKITVNETNAPLSKVLQLIQQQSGYDFFYNQTLLMSGKTVTLHVKNASVQKTLELCFADQPELTYTLLDQAVVIKRKTKKIQNDSTFNMSPTVIQKPIHGKVTDSSGKPISGASVTLLKTKKGVFTDNNGEFNINAEKGDNLEISYVGYTKNTVTIGSNLEVNVILAIQQTALNDIVIVGFGTQKKTDVTGSIYQVGAKEIQNRPVTNLGQALQGVIPNLNISVSNGSPNSKPSYNIRGGTSFGKNTDGNFVAQNGSPYTLVDGVEMDINLINPDDIESVTTLNDAASSAIYGARAAFGVLLVTTKKGKYKSKPSFSFSNMYQWSKPTAVPDMLSSVQIQQAAVDAYGLIGQSAPQDQLTLLDSVKAYAADPAHHSPFYYTTPYDPVNNPYPAIIWNANTNPYKAGVKSSTPIEKYSISAAGGGDKTNYYLSLGYMDQSGIYKINTDKYKRYNFMLNTSSVFTDWFKLDVKTNYIRETYSQPVNPSGKGGWWRAFSQESNRNIFMPLKTPDDSPLPDYYTGNILSYMAYGSNDGTDNSTLMITASPTITPLKNWNIKGDISYRANFDYEKTVVPLLQKVETSFNPDLLTTDYTNPSYIYKDKNNTYHYTINAYTDYTLKIKDHSLYGMVGFNQELEKYNDLYAQGNGIINNEVTSINLTTDKSSTPPGDAENEYAVRGGFYRLTYNYKDKYFIESNGRYDLSSKFPTDRRGKLFPGISAGWRVSEEDFMKSTKNVISELKLRGSYASLGNQNVDNYMYTPTYGTVTQVDQIFDGSRPVGITAPGLVSPTLTWETATTLDLGADLILIHKLNASFSWYRRRTSDILVDGIKYPAVLGASSPTVNSGIMQTKGFEFQLNWKDVTSGGFNYSIAFNVSNYTSKIISFNNNPTLLLSTLYAGETVGDIWGYVTDGLYQNQQEIDNGPNEANILTGKLYPGDVRFKDLDGNDTISQGQNTLTNHGDKKIIGNSTPKFAFGLNSFFSWKNFDLNLFFQGVAKRDYYISDNLYWGVINGGSGTKEVYENSWTPDRTDAEYPAYRSGQSGNITTQTRFLKNAAYIRLKNISIGYTLPQSMAKKIAMKSLRISASGYDLLTFSGVPKYFDPEVLSADYPILKSYALSLQLNF